MAFLLLALAAVLLAGCVGGGDQGGAKAGDQAAAAFSSSAPGSCSDKWINSAVYAVTSVAPQGKVCDIYLYNNGSWSSYDQLEGAVRTRMSECSDKWVTQALIEVYGRGGYDKASQCTINRYGGGSWSSYADLRTKVSKSTYCRDPWVGQAVHFATGRNPVGAGLTSRSVTGDCNIYLYGNGKWSGFSGLVSEAKKTHTNLANANRTVDGSGNLKNKSTGATVYTSDKGFVDLANSTDYATGAGQVIAAGGANVVAAGGANITVGGGNVVAAGGAN